MSAATPWVNPIVKRGTAAGALWEVTPFVFKGRLYRLENIKETDITGDPDFQHHFREDGFRIRDLAANRVVSIPLLNHYFAIAFVWQDRVHVYAGNYGETEPWWHIREIVHLSSTDLITWTAPEVVIRSERGERLFNTAVCWDGRRFVLLYETDDKRWPAFTFKYCAGPDLTHFERLPNALYGVDKYVGGPALYYEGDWYYTLYLQSLGGGTYETRVTRSRDLVTWHDAPAGRAFLPYDPTRRPDPVHHPDVYERNASDAELCEWQGKTLIYFNGGNQLGVCDLQWADYDGTPRQLLEAFFAP